MFARILLGPYSDSALPRFTVVKSFAKERNGESESPLGRTSSWSTADRSGGEAVLLGRPIGNEHSVRIVDGDGLDGLCCYSVITAGSLPCAIPEVRLAVVFVDRPCPLGTQRSLPAGWLGCMQLKPW